MRAQIIKYVKYYTIFSSTDFGLEFFCKILLSIGHNLSTAAVTIESGKKFARAVVSGLCEVQWQSLEFFSEKVP